MFVVGAASEVLLLELLPDVEDTAEEPDVDDVLVVSEVEVGVEVEVEPDVEVVLEVVLEVEEPDVVRDELLEVLVLVFVDVEGGEDESTDDELVEELGLSPGRSVPVVVRPEGVSPAGVVVPVLVVAVRPDAELAQPPDAGPGPFRRGPPPAGWLDDEELATTTLAFWLPSTSSWISPSPSPLSLGTTAATGFGSEPVPWSRSPIPPTRTGTASAAPRISLPRAACRRRSSSRRLRRRATSCAGPRPEDG